MGKRSAFLDVQKAIFATLDGDTTLKALVKGVWDDVPQSTAYPYVQIGEAIETNDNRFGTTGRSVLTTVHIWSRAKGFSECEAIFEEVTRLIDETLLVVAGGWACEMSELELAQTIRDPDGQTRHVVANYRVIVERQVGT